MLKQQAIKTIIAAISPNGICASSIASENYKRVWSRDAVMAGLAGFMAGDETIIAALKKSLDTLKNHQHPIGFIPSNVGEKVSYGSLVGRVDATLWYIIGVGFYYQYKKDEKFLEKHRASIQKAISLTQAWEFNGRHLIYTPLSGNWADEYPIQGYTLYDNCLRLWGYRLWKMLLPKIIADEKIKDITKAIQENFWVTNTEIGKEKYHPSLYQNASHKNHSQYFEAGFSPAKYYRMFDAAGNGLALILSLATEAQVNQLEQYLASVFLHLNNNLMPAFWPPIEKGDVLWDDLAMNYSYTFKNHPHHFHNGGIWPIMMGWLCLGLRVQGRHEWPDKMAAAYEKIAVAEAFTFSEYISSDHFIPSGKRQMCFSAAGAIYMLEGAENKLLY